MLLQDECETDKSHWLWLKNVNGWSECVANIETGNCIFFRHDGTAVMGGIDFDTEAADLIRQKLGGK